MMMPLWEFILNFDPINKCAFIRILVSENCRQGQFDFLGCVVGGFGLSSSSIVSICPVELVLTNRMNIDAYVIDMELQRRNMAEVFSFLFLFLSKYFQEKVFHTGSFFWSTHFHSCLIKQMMTAYKTKISKLESALKVSHFSLHIQFILLHDIAQ
jgi:hypothetical protein